METVADLPGGAGNIRIVNCRKSLCTIILTESESNQPYILSEFQVMGKGSDCQTHKGLSKIIINWF